MLLVRPSQNLFPTIFNDLFDMNNFNAVSTGVNPQMNIIENEDNYKMELCVPGSTKEDFNLSVDEDNNLVISMEKKSENREKDKKGHYLRHEFSFSQFKQSFALPDNVEKEKISAKAENGVLSIYLPKVKMEEQKKLPQSILIE